MSSEELVYHYTTAEGLLGILQTNAFWSTRIDYLNDKKEYLGGMKMLSDSVGREVLDKRKNFMAAPYELLAGKNLVESRNVLLLVEQVLRGQPQELELYSTSFTSERDSVKHWMAYTKPNNAYCIGLSRKQLFSHFNDTHNMFRSVSYPSNEDICMPLIRAALVLLKATIKEDLFPFVSQRKSYFSLREKIISRRLYLEVLSKVNMYACFAKDTSFSHELETRLVTVQLTDFIDNTEHLIGVKDYPKQIKSSDVFYRPAAGMLIPTKSVYVPKEAIKEVIVGPHHSSYLAARSVKELTQKLGYTLTVNESCVPLRHL